FFPSPGDHEAPHPFPTRRSSDLALMQDASRHAVAREQVLSREFGDIVRSYPLIQHAAVYEQELQVRVEHRKANFSTWYELFPRRSEEHTSELQSRENLVCRLLLE